MDKNELLKLLSLPKSEGGINQIQESGFSKMFPDVYEDFRSWNFSEGFSFKQMLYHYLNDDADLKLGLCHNCGKRCRFDSIRDGYRSYCSNSCAQSSSEIIMKRKFTCKDKYGDENFNNRDKSKRTCTELYGTDNPQKSDAVRKKSRMTKYERYGDENFNNSEKIRMTKIERYNHGGYNNVEKSKRTNSEKYGVENVFQLQSVKEKSVNTMMSLYGVEHPLQSDVFMEKSKKTNNERYGVDFPMQSDAVKDTLMNNNMEKYGVECTLQLDDVREKSKHTCIEKYGVEHPSQSDEVREKFRQTCMDRYGVECPTKLSEVKEKSKQTCREKYGCDYASQSEAFKERVMTTNMEKYGVPWYCMSDECKGNYKKNSKVNQRFSEILDANGIAHEKEYPIGNYSYDFKVGNTLVELNPTITHNCAINVFGGEPKSKKYHHEKSDAAVAAGFHCIHVWDWDDQTKIVNMLKPKKTLYARKLKIYSIGSKEAGIFLDKYHLQGTCKGQTVCLGLYMDETLIEIMTFGKPRYNKNYEWELLRLCTHCDYKVVGGAERLFKHFVEMHKPYSVISYCDASKFSGDVYRKIGFDNYKYNNPSKHWWDGVRHITDNFLRQRGYDQLFNEEYGKGTSNEELMLLRGFLPLYDCGQMTFTWGDGTPKEDVEPKKALF